MTNKVRLLPSCNIDTIVTNNHFVWQNKIRLLPSCNIDTIVTNNYFVWQNKIRCKFTNRRRYATFHLLALALFARSVAICEIFTVQMCLTWIVTFSVGQDQMYICQWKGRMQLFFYICWHCNSNFCHICHCLQEIQSNCARPWRWPLERAKVTSKYTTQKAHKGLHILLQQ